MQTGQKKYFTNIPAKNCPVEKKKREGGPLKNNADMHALKKSKSSAE